MPFPLSIARGVRVRHSGALMLLVLALALPATRVPASAETRRYNVQSDVSEVGFRATSRLMNADGRFHRMRGEIVVDPKDLSTARIGVTIESASIDTGIGLRDTHLRSKDFLDVEKFPDIIFESVRVEATGRRATVTGRLTLRGISKEIAVPVDVAVSDVALVATGELVMNRRDYGMDYNSFVNPIGNEVRVNFTIRARAS